MKRKDCAVPVDKVSGDTRFDGGATAITTHTLRRWLHKATQRSPHSVGGPCLCPTCVDIRRVMVETE